MRLRIAHSTSYRYEPPASGVIQILRMTPGSHDGQYVAEWQIDVSTDSRLDVHQDAFGNVTHVLTHGPIADLTINVEGLIETHDTGGVLRGTDERFRRACSCARPTLTEVNPAMATFVRELRAEADDDVLGFLHALMVQINEHMTFDEDPTNSGTSAIEAFGRQARRVPGLRAYLHRLRAQRRHPGALCFRTFPALRRHGQPAGRPRLGGGLRAGPRLGRFRSGQRHLHHRRPCPRRHRRSIISAPRRCAAPATAAAWKP